MKKVLELFNLVHHTIYGGMGAVSINMVHMPYPGIVTDQPAKLMELFEFIKDETLKCISARMNDA